MSQDFCLPRVAWKHITENMGIGPLRSPGLGGVTQKTIGLRLTSHQLSFSPPKFLSPIQKSQWVILPRLSWPLTSGALLVPHLSHLFYSEISEAEVGLGDPPV